MSRELRDFLLPDPDEMNAKVRAAVSVDGADGPTAHRVLAPLGLWPPKLDPAAVIEVGVEVPDRNDLARVRLHFKEAKGGG